jgi:protocatechuate 3,4-dioxygenase beta subunit
MAGNHEEHPGHSRDPQNIFDFRWGDPAKFHQGCALTPTSVYGPFWHERQPLRVDIRAGERGIYLRLAMQIIDVATCKPLPNVQVDIWEANSLGNYSATMDGYLRGWQPTSNQGTVDFDTNFSGHYVDRASHVHLAVRSPGEKRVVNFGQVYFDQNIRDEVEVSRLEGFTLFYADISSEPIATRSTTSS